MLIITFVTLIAGEVIPKRVALLHAETLALRVAPIMRLTRTGSLPRPSGCCASRWMRFSGCCRSRPRLNRQSPKTTCARWSPKARRSAYSYETERRLLEGVLALADRKVGSIMIPRQDVIWLDIEEPIESLWQRAKKSGHARFLMAREKFETCSAWIALARPERSRCVRGVLDADRDLEPPLHIPDWILVLQLLDQFQK